MSYEYIGISSRYYIMQCDRIGLITFLNYKSLINLINLVLIRNLLKLNLSHDCVNVSMI